MFADIKDASQYTAQFLDSYYQQSDWLDQETIATGIQELMVEKIQWQSIDLPRDKDIGNVSISEIDVLMSSQLKNYDVVLQQAVIDFLWGFVDIEYSSVTQR